MAQPTHLIVVMAFSRSDEGELVPAFEPMQNESEDRAIQFARELAGKHAGVIAWVRDVEPDKGVYGPPTILFQSGDVPEME